MGRRKIEIKAIKDDRNRSVTFLKRKGGLFKKAHELSVLCQVDIAVIIFGQNKKVYEFSSGDINELVRRYQNEKKPKGLQDEDKNERILSSLPQKPTEAELDVEPTANCAPGPQQSSYSLQVQERINELKPPQFRQCGLPPHPQDQHHINAQEDKWIEFSSVVPWYPQQEPLYTQPQDLCQELQLQSWLSSPPKWQLEANPLPATPKLLTSIDWTSLAQHWGSSMNCLQPNRRPKLTVQIPYEIPENEKWTSAKILPPASVAAIGTQIYDYHSDELFPLLSSSYTLLSAGGRWPLENAKILNTNNEDTQAPFSALLTFKSWKNGDTGDSNMLPSPLVFPNPLQSNRSGFGAEKKRRLLEGGSEYSDKRLKGI